MKHQDCKWCPLLPITARYIVLEAARRDRDHGLGKQCHRCRQIDWGLKTINVNLRQIEVENQRLRLQLIREFEGDVAKAESVWADPMGREYAEVLMQEGAS